MLKIVTLFLVFIAVLAMFGRLHWLRIGKRKGDRDASLPKPRLCPECGRYNLRGGACTKCRNDAG